MIKEVKTFKRTELFKHYHSFTNPFIITTTKIDITNVVNYCKIRKNLYGTLGYLIAKTANNIEEFKYRYKEGKIYFCQEIKPNYVGKYDDDTIGYFDVPLKDNFKEYINDFKIIQEQFKKSKKYSLENDLNEIWLSCQPWFNFSSLVPTYDKEISIPQFIWDKYELIDNKYYINLLIMVHHGFADGYHVGKFINDLQELINNFNEK